MMWRKQEEEDGRSTSSFVAARPERDSDVLALSIAEVLRPLDQPSISWVLLSPVGLLALSLSGQVVSPSLLFTLRLFVINPSSKVVKC